jgi:aminoglycoside phosphotransferase family enzyme/predicted kinase
LWMLNGACRQRVKLDLPDQCGAGKAHAWHVLRYTVQMGAHAMLQAHSPPDVQVALVAAVSRVLEAGGHRVSRFETHISWVLVAGDIAYKFKKAVRLDFLDFSTLAARRFYCDEELRLNRRLSPDLYLDVVSITGDAAHPVVGGDGRALEYAVRLRAFPQHALWAERLAAGLLGASEVDDLAAILSAFHRDVPAASAGSVWGTLATLAASANQIMTTLDPLLTAQAAGQADLAKVRAWEAGERMRLADTFIQRKAAGRVRECHGDLHVGNIVTSERGVEAFDCVEFSEALRWIDVMNDMAFICMDLQFRRRVDLAARLLNRYLAFTGDYEGLAVLRYYLVQKALVRSMVALLQIGQPCAAAAGHARQGLDYLAYAVKQTGRGKAAMLLTCGCSGSGKTSFAALVVELVGAVQLRSDVERKRLHGLAPTDRSGGRPGSALYDPAATERTYDRLLALARLGLAAGFPVIVDASFLASAQRRKFADCASELGIPFFIFDIRASKDTMKRRIAARVGAGLDASDAGADVLARQLARAEPLSAGEQAHAITVDMESGIDLAAAEALCKPVAAAIAMSSGCDS